MRAVVQRIKEARVMVEDRTVAMSSAGLVAFLSLEKGDTERTGEEMVHTLLKLRLFPDHTGKMAISLRDFGGDLLFISNFTLSGELRRGNRPDFSRALPRPLAQELYEKIVAHARSLYPRVQSGEFGSFMEIRAVHDGPVTLFLQWV